MSRRQPLRDPSDLSPRSAMIVVVAAVLLCFGRLITAGWVTWDDEPFIATNPMYVTPTLRSLAYYWHRPFYDIYIPITGTAWAFIAFVARSDVPDARGLLLNPHVYHGVNVLVHAACGVIVFVLLRRLFGRTWPALAGALVFALHPVQVETVAWVSGLKDLLAGLFSIATLLLYFIAAGEPDSRRRARLYVATVVVFLMALLAKPSAMTTAALVVALDVLLLRRPWKTMAAWWMPLLLLAIACAAFARFTQPPIPEAHDVPLWGRPLLVGHSLAFYLGKVIWPAQLTVDYGRHPDAVWRDGHVYLAWIVPAVLLAASLIVYRRSRWPLVILAIFVIAPLHTLGLVTFDFQFFSTVADHYLYTAMLGIAVLAAWLFTLAPRQVAITATVVLALALAVRSIAQTAVWQDSESLYANGLRVDPESWSIRTSLGALAMERGDFRRAIELSQEAIDRRPRYPIPWLTLASAKRELGDLAGAETAYRQSLAIARKVETLTNLGGLLAQMGRHEEAERLLRESLAADPENAKGYLNLGVMRVHQDRLDEAAKLLRQAVELSPGDVDARVNYGVVLLDLGRRVEGVEQLRAAARLQPNNTRLRELARSLGISL